MAEPNQPQGYYSERQGKLMLLTLWWGLIPLEIACEQMGVDKQDPRARQAFLEELMQSVQDGYLNIHQTEVQRDAQGNPAVRPDGKPIQPNYLLQLRPEGLRALGGEKITGSVAPFRTTCAEMLEAVWGQLQAMLRKERIQ